MALVKGLNSYATVEEADAYFLDRIDVAAWTAASSDQKSQALITATSVLDSLTWTGVVQNSAQTLAFPRTGQYFDPKIGYIQEMVGTPSRVVIACYEIAYHLLNNDGLLDSTGSVMNISVGSIAISGIKDIPKIPLFVKNMIKPLLLRSGSKLWWRSN